MSCKSTHRTELIAKPHDLSWPDRFEHFEAFLHQRKKVFQKYRFPAKNNEGNLPASDILLVFETSVYGDEHLELSSFCFSQ